MLFSELNVFMAGVLVGAVLALAFDHYVLPPIAHALWVRMHRSGRSRRRDAA